MSDDIRSLIEIQDRSFERAGPGLREPFPRNVVMDASRMAEFLDGKRYAVLATGRRDGRPHAAPIQEYTAAGPADPRFAEDWRLRHGTDPRWASRCSSCGRSAYSHSTERESPRTTGGGTHEGHGAAGGTVLA